MDYISAQQQGDDTVLTGIKHFDLAQILDCGQAFRWVLTDEGRFTGVAHGRRLDILLSNGDLILKDVPLAEFESVWKDYFGLGQNYGNLREMLQIDDNMGKALEFSPGLRLMRQDAWEILISFILSQNSNIPRIKKMIALLCQRFGKELSCGMFAFPSPEAIAALTVDTLDEIKLGYRAPYIIDAAQRVVDGSLDLAGISARPTYAVREALLKVHGVGPKVADCVLLFGFGRLECFPMDVHMKRVMAYFYPKGLPDGLIEYAGIAQQFLFHYARVHGL